MFNVLEVHCVKFNTSPSYVPVTFIYYLLQIIAAPCNDKRLSERGLRDTPSWNSSNVIFIFSKLF